MIKDHKAKIDGLTVFYRTAGGPRKQALVFLHGWGVRLGTSPLLGSDRVIEELSKYFYVISPEHPGLIRSEAPKEAWNYPNYAQSLHRLLSFLRVKRPVIMGQSFGGGIASAYASLYQRNLRALVLVDSVLSNRLDNLFFKIRRWWGNKYQGVLRSFFVPKIIKKILTVLYLGVPARYVTDKTLQNRLVMGETLEKLKLDVDYGSLKIPVLLVWGEGDTSITPISGARIIQKGIRSSKLVTIAGGHSVLYQKPKEVAGLIVKNLKEL